MSKKVAPLVDSDYQDWEIKKKEVGLIEQKFIDRVSHIVKELSKAFGAKIDTWYFPDAEQGEVGELSSAFGFGGLQIEVIYTKRPEAMVANITEPDCTISEWEFEYGEYPQHWLYQDFEDDLKKGIERYEKSEEERKAKAKKKRTAKQKEKDALKASAATKLTKAERKALGL